MSEPLDLAAPDDPGTPEERAVRAALRRDLVAALPAPDGRGPDFELLALRALAGEPLPADEAAPALTPAADLLDAAERVRLDAARPALDAALDRHPALADVVRRFRTDRDAFEQAWVAHTAVPARPEAPTPRRSADRPAARRTAAGPVWRNVGRLTAAVAVVAMVALATYLFQRDAGLTRVVAGQPMAIDLPDGTTVELAAGAELLVPEVAAARSHETTGGEPEAAPRRYARLVAGSALFRVAHADSPFVVETPTAEVNVLGTTFGVTASNGSTSVVLVAGRVEVTGKRRAGTPVQLTPGQASRVVAGQAPTPARAADLDVALEWTGDLFLRAEPLSSAAARISSAFGVPVEVAPTLAGEAVTGRFARAEGVEATLRALALAVDAGVEPRPEGGYRIARGGD